MPTVVAMPEVLTLEKLAIRYGPVELQKPLTRAEFAALAECYPDLAMEREANGTVLVMSPVKRGSGKREPLLYGFLFIWYLYLVSASFQHDPDFGNFNN
ncbi:MAG: hypothetical protein IPH12_01220 [Saprospirales bacterium]|nr:hypothetical protein [Saprospirales bacterium]